MTLPTFSPIPCIRVVPRCAGVEDQIGHVNDAVHRSADLIIIRARSSFLAWAAVGTAALAIEPHKNPTALMGEELAARLKF